MQRLGQIDRGFEFKPTRRGSDQATRKFCSFAKCADRVVELTFGQLHVSERRADARPGFNCGSSLAKFDCLTHPFGGLLRLVSLQSYQCQSRQRLAFADRVRASKRAALLGQPLGSLGSLQPNERARKLKLIFSDVLLQIMTPHTSSGPL